MRSTYSICFKILHGFLLEFSNSGKCVVRPTSGGLRGWLGAVSGEGGVCCPMFYPHVRLFQNPR